MGGAGDSSRRDFLKKCAIGTAALSTSVWPRAEAQSDNVTSKSTVVVAHDDRLRGSGTSVDSQRVLSLLDRGMQALYGTDSPIEPWKKLVRPGQKVGVKVNALGGRGLATNVLVVDAICHRLQEAGIRASDIVIWDRDTSELERAGFRVSTSGNGVHCFGTDQIGYEDDLVSFGTVGSRLSKILTQCSDVMINVPILKDHELAGVTIALKNIYGVIHNPNKCHPNGCNPYVADLNTVPQIRGKMRLTICDATTACYEGGPGFKPQYCWKENSLLLAQDPVALDYIGWQIIDQKRIEKGLKTLEAEKRPPAYIAVAADAKHRLGTDDPKRIARVQA